MYQTFEYMTDGTDASNMNEFDLGMGENVKFTTFGGQCRSIREKLHLPDIMETVCMVDLKFIIKLFLPNISCYS